MSGSPSSKMGIFMDFQWPCSEKTQENPEKPRKIPGYPEQSRKSPSGGSWALLEASQLAGGLAGWPAGWLAGWLDGLAGWLSTQAPAQPISLALLFSSVMFNEYLGLVSP